MASHHQPGNITPLHRGIADQPRDYAARPVDLIDQLREHDFREPTLLERLADFFKSDRGISFMWGFYSGAMLTVGAAFLWGFAL